MDTKAMLNRLFEFLEFLSERDQRWVSNLIFRDKELTDKEKKELIKLYDKHFMYGVE